MWALSSVRTHRDQHRSSGPARLKRWPRIVTPMPNPTVHGSRVCSGRTAVVPIRRGVRPRRTLTSTQRHRNDSERRGCWSIKAATEQACASGMNPQRGRPPVRPALRMARASRVRCRLPCLARIRGGLRHASGRAPASDSSLANLGTACADPARPCSGDSADIAAVALRELGASANVAKHCRGSGRWKRESDRRRSVPLVADPGQNPPRRGRIRCGRGAVRSPRAGRPLHGPRRLHRVLGV